MNHTKPIQAEAASSAASAFSVIDALGFARLYRRPGALDGSIPMRGAQCQPFLDGNSAGWHLQLVDPAMLATDEGGPLLRLTDETLERITTGYDTRLATLVSRGLLEEDGLWHRELSGGPVVRNGQSLQLWTGLLLKPEPGLWLSVTRAFNRSVPVAVKPFVIAGDAWVPLVLEIAADPEAPAETWFDTDLACIQPLRPASQVRLTNLEDHPEPLHTIASFYSQEYLDRRKDQKYSGQYRQSAVAGSAPEEASACEFTVSLAGSINRVYVRRFERFATASGYTTEPPDGASYEFIEVSSEVDVELRWDRNNIRDIAIDPPDAPDQAHAGLVRIIGEERAERLRWWSSYVIPFLGPHRGEPFNNLMLQGFFETSTGWSAISDGISFPGLDGMRGIVRTDSFPSLPATHQFRRDGVFHFPRGQTVVRVFPVPRSLLNAGATITTHSESNLE